MAFKVTDKSRHDMGTVSPLPSIYSYLPKISCAHVWQNCTHARNHHPYNFALCRPFVRGHCLRVYVKRDPTVCVPQKLLHGFDVLSVCLQQRAEGVAKGMQPMFLVIPAFFATGLMYRFMRLSGQ